MLPFDLCARIASCLEPDEGKRCRLLCRDMRDAVDRATRILSVELTVDTGLQWHPYIPSSLLRRRKELRLRLSYDRSLPGIEVMVHYQEFARQVTKVFGNPKCALHFQVPELYADAIVCSDAVTSIDEVTTAMFAGGILTYVDVYFLRFRSHSSFGTAVYGW